MNRQRKEYLNDWVKKTATELGFSYCGVAKAGSLDEDARRLERWLAAGFHGQMAYMANHFELRIDPRKLVPGAQSVITLLLNYFPQKVQEPTAPKVSRYAYGTDYHIVVRDKLNSFLRKLREVAGDVQGRGFVDSAPVLERAWAVRTGLGWIGKNGNLLTRHSGSYLFIATLITDLEMEVDAPFAADYCGTCTRCIDACPTEAILPGKVVDGSRCISYYTIELKSALIPEAYAGSFENWIFGCDICQEVCPWNRFAQPHDESALNPLPGLLEFTKSDWQLLTEDTFRKMFKDSPLKRTGFKGISRNLRFIEQTPDSNQCKKKDDSD